MLQRPAVTVFKLGLQGAQALHELRVVTPAAVRLRHGMGYRVVFEQQIAALGAFCEREQISRAEAIRRAVDALLASQSPAGRELAFGAWDRRADSSEWIDKLRGEWERPMKP